ncbi:MAG: hypothetical protein Q9196_001804 [Gyalolechia fulgens]
MRSLKSVCVYTIFIFPLLVVPMELEIQPDKQLIHTAAHDTALITEPNHPISVRQFVVVPLWQPVFQYVVIIAMSITSAPLFWELGTTFYNKILDTVLDAWAKSPPYNQFVVEAGGMRWEFGCTVHPIPQQFLEEYYRSKRDAVKRGFAPGYATEWWFARDDRARRCYAGQRIVAEGGEIVPPA